MAFQNIGHKEGLDVWKVRSGQVQILPKEVHGVFYSGDSYIVLKTVHVKGGGFSCTLHFWLGNDCSVEDQSSAALLTVEADNVLGGRTTIYRELQGYETDLFISCFRPCIIPMPGASPETLTVTHTLSKETRLFLCCGSPFMRVRQLPLTRSSLDQSDVFILDTAAKIFQFNGANSNPRERTGALDIVAHIRDKNHNGKASVAVIDAAKLGTDSDTGEFWEFFGGFAPISKQQKSLRDDSTSPPTVPGKLFLAKVSGEPSEVSGPLRKDTLSSCECYVLDCGSTVYVWTGKLSKVEDKKAALMQGQRLTANASRPPSTRLIRVSEGREDATFASSFEMWPHPGQRGRAQDPRSKMTARLKFMGMDTAKGSAAVSSSLEEAEARLVDPSGNLEVWRVDSGKKTALPPEEVGKFYGGDSYIILYTYKGERREEYLIFYWLGRSSKEEEKASAATLASQLDESLRARAVQVRVVQGKEPAQFVVLFKGKMIVLEGRSTSSNNDASLLQVQRHSPMNTKTVQVKTSATSLNGSYCFVLMLNSVTYIWIGSSSAAEDRTVAMDAAATLRPSGAIKELKEGKEVGVFWDALGGRMDYGSAVESLETEKNARLFLCMGSAAGSFQVTELHNFAQEDLNSTDVLILDTGVEVFVWVGHLASDAEKKAAISWGQEYLRLEGMSALTPIIKVPEGHELPALMSHFQWDPSNIAFVDPYEKRLANLQGRKPVTAVVSEGPRRRSSTTPAASPEIRGVAGPYTVPSPVSPALTPSSPRWPAPVRTSAAAAAPQTPRSPQQHHDHPSAASAVSPMSATSQRAAAMAALASSLRGEPATPNGTRPKTPATVDGDWVAIAGPDQQHQQQQQQTPAPQAAPPPIVGSPRSPKTRSQRAAAMAALSPSLAGEPGLSSTLSRKEPLDGGWVKVTSPADIGQRPGAKEGQVSTSPSQISRVVEEPSPRAEAAAAAAPGTPQPPATAPPMQGIIAEEEDDALPPPAIPTSSSSANSTSLSYAQIRSSVGVSEPPIPGFDVTKRESYLSDKEFQAVFKLSKENFYALPKWKQEAKKKQLDLF